MYSKVFLIGRLTRDIELRYAGETPVCDIGLAINRNYKKNGENVEEVFFVDVTIWDSQAVNCQKFLSKGSLVAVDGRLAMDKWENNTGEIRKKLKVIASVVKFLSPRDDRQEKNNYQEENKHKSENQYDAETEKDVPF